MSKKKVSFVLGNGNTNENAIGDTPKKNTKEEKIKKIERLQQAMSPDTSKKLQEQEDFHRREFGEKEKYKYISIYCSERLLERLDKAVEEIKEELPNNPHLQKLFQSKRDFSKSIFIKKAIIEMLDRFEK